MLLGASRTILGRFLTKTFQSKQNQQMQKNEKLQLLCFAILGPETIHFLYNLLLKRYISEKVCIDLRE